MRLHSFTFEGDSCAASLTSAQLFLSLCSEPVYTVANSRELLQLLTSKEESKVFGVTLDVISLKKGNSVAPFQRMLSVAFCGKKCQQSSTMEKTERGKLKLLSFSSHLTAQHSSLITAWGGCARLIVGFRTLWKRSETDPLILHGERCVWFTGFLKIFKRPKGSSDGIYRLSHLSTCGLTAPPAGQLAGTVHCKVVFSPDETLWWFNAACGGVGCVYLWWK